MHRLRPSRITTFLLALFLLNRWIESRGLSFIPVRSWLDDVLVLPLALGFALWIHRRRRGGSWTIPMFQVIVAVVLYALVFELVLPSYLDSAVADPLDVVAYAVGGVLFQLLLNRPLAVEDR